LRALRLVALLAVFGCSPTQRHLRRAAQAMEECDLRTAHTEFDEAWTRSPDQLDAAIGFALTGLVLLPEDKHLNSALLELGFTRKIDAEHLLYGKHALLEQLSHASDCEQIDALLESELAYPPLWDDIAPGELVHSDTTLEDLLDDLARMEPHLQRLAQAFEAAGDLLEEPYEIELSGSCGAGLGRVVLQAPELYAVSAGLTAVRAGLVAAQGYDWDMEVRVLFEGSPSQRLETYNEHLLRVTHPADLEEAGTILAKALVLADLALAEASRVEREVPHAVIGWSELDRDLIDDLRSIGDAALAALEGQGMQEVPFWSPPLQADAGSLFLSPPDTAELDGPLFLLDDGSIYAHEERLKSLFVDRFDRDIFDSEQDEQWTIGDRWEQHDLQPVLDPGGRYSESYECQ
jgi:hypothetical protein